LEKLRSSRLADPQHWVLEVLRAAQGSGAKSVDVRSDAGLVSLSFDGKAFSPAVMKDLLTQALGSDDGAEPRIRLFALGVAGALGAGVKSVRAQSGKVRLDFDELGAVEVSDATDGARTSVEAHKKMSLKVAAAWFTGKSGEVGAIEQACRWYGPALKIN